MAPGGACQLSSSAEGGVAKTPQQSRSDLHNTVVLKKHMRHNCEKQKMAICDPGTPPTKITFLFLTYVSIYTEA